MLRKLENPLWFLLSAMFKHSKDEESSIIEAKKIVSALILKVLAHNICVREALKLFPAEVYDLSIQCAWHSLVHYEADEDLRKKDAEYAEEQDEYLEMIAYILRDGMDIPHNIISSYENYYDYALIPRKDKGIINKIRNLFRLII